MRWSRTGRRAVVRWAVSGVIRPPPPPVVYRFSYDIGRMDSDYDPEHAAQEAMRLAAEAAGLDRQRWLNLAMAWQELGRMRTDSTSGGTVSGRKTVDSRGRCRSSSAHR